MLFLVHPLDAIFQYLTDHISLVICSICAIFATRKWFVYRETLLTAYKTLEDSKCDHCSAIMHSWTPLLEKYKTKARNIGKGIVKTAGTIGGFVLGILLETHVGSPTISFDSPSTKMKCTFCGFIRDHRYYTVEDAEVNQARLSRRKPTLIISILFTIIAAVLLVSFLIECI